MSYLLFRTFLLTKAHTFLQKNLLENLFHNPYIVEVLIKINISIWKEYVNKNNQSMMIIMIEIFYS